MFVSQIWTAKKPSQAVFLFAQSVDTGIAANSIVAAQGVNAGIPVAEAQSVGTRLIANSVVVAPEAALVSNISTTPDRGRRHCRVYYKRVKVHHRWEIIKYIVCRYY
jgi:hypothetical protein